jgi:hypothetical protein
LAGAVAQGAEKPAWLGPPDAGFSQIDYTRFKPRGFYTQSETLQRYFRAVAWLQAIPFRVEKDEELSLPLDARLYVQRLKQRIERNIRELLDLSPHAKTLRGRVVFHLLVHRSGALMELQYVEHAEHPILNIIAEQAIRRSDPFQPFYASMKAPYMLRAIAVRY